MTVIGMPVNKGLMVVLQFPENHIWPKEFIIFFSLSSHISQYWGDYHMVLCFNFHLSNRIMTDTWSLRNINCHYYTCVRVPFFVTVSFLFHFPYHWLTPLYYSLSFFHYDSISSFYFSSFPLPIITYSDPSFFRSSYPIHTLLLPKTFPTLSPHRISV